MSADGLIVTNYHVVEGSSTVKVILNTGKELQARCDANHITLNKNAIPGDPEKPSVTSGVRIGTAAVTTRGLGTEEMEKNCALHCSDCQEF